MDNIMKIKRGPSREKLFDSLRLSNRSYGVTVEFTEETSGDETSFCIEVVIETLSLVFRSEEIWTFSGSIKRLKKELSGAKTEYFGDYLIGQYDTSKRTGWMKFCMKDFISERRDWWRLQRDN